MLEIRTLQIVSFGVQIVRIIHFVINLSKPLVANWWGLKTLSFMASTRHPSPEEKGTRSFRDALNNEIGLG